MTDEELRLECLKLAIDITDRTTPGNTGKPPGKIVRAAEKFAKFVIEGGSEYVSLCPVLKWKK